MMTKMPSVLSWFDRLILGAMLLAVLAIAGCGVVHHPSQSETHNVSDDQTAVPEDSATAVDEFAYQPHSGTAGDTDDRRIVPGNITSPDFAEADTEYAPEDDALWQAFRVAEDYYHMGVTANRESSWEEAQYYFEKALKVLGSLDVDTDSALTPEAVRYNTLLDNVVSDYRTTLRSLGKLDENAAPSAIVERFGDLETKLGSDSMHVYKSERSPVSYDLPVVMNSRVKASIVYFQTVANEAFRRYLGRSKKYCNMFKRVLREKGLPEDLIYLSLVESGYNPHAYSWARAMGLWQFIASTGKLYGLDRNWWMDERKDPEKATEAAATFLKELYEQFGSWELAMAAYNGGPGRVGRTIQAQRTSDFWKMRLRQQTMDYVPLIYAAIIIGKEPEKYGFSDIVYEPELTYDTVMIDRCLDLRVIADRIGCSVDTLKALNPELLRNYTPPNTRNYRFRVPSGMTKMFEMAYNDMPEAKGANFAHHKVKKRESLASIANRYGVSQYAILEANNMDKGTKIKSGMDLVIPIVSGSSDAPSAPSKSTSASSKNYKTEKSIYTVRPGDTMWDIAKAFKTSPEELRQVNYLGKDDRLAVGQKIRIPSYANKGTELASLNDDSVGAEMSEPTPVPSNPKSDAARKSSAAKSAGAPKVYVVKSGDTIWDIAKKFNTSASAIRDQNGLSKSARIFIGQQLAVAPGESDATQVVIYKIRNGDTLSRIAQKYNTTIAKIVAANALNNPQALKPGDRIKILVD
ncbi:MAG: LysM peptidoglycan-binding domain-containing protein [Candidatus Zixiibacteriota bacterium]